MELSRHSLDAAPGGNQAAGNFRTADLAPTVLVIDDEWTGRKSSSMLLESWGHRVLEADSGEQALEILGQHEPDLILLDWHMPTMSGLDFCSRLKQSDDLASIPVIFVSAVNDPARVSATYSAGAVDFISKPFTEDDLRGRLQTHVQLLKSRRQVAKLQHSLQDELALAAACITGMQPPFLDDPRIAMDWKLIPTETIGGDSVGYHFVDDHALALYSMDVSGRGVGTALMASYIVNVLQSGQLGSENVYRDPHQLLDSLQHTLAKPPAKARMFTLWYGVLDLRSGKLDYATAGHPAPLLLDQKGKFLQRLHTGEAAIGMGLGQDASYHVDSVYLKPGDELYLFSDGAFNFPLPPGQDWDSGQFCRIIQDVRKRAHPGHDLAELYLRLLLVQGMQSLEDDFAIARIQYRDA